MPYKSKRTRDLQGEVVAGTGITITEQTKPDGTKEYTITNGDPASAITVDGTGLSLINNVLRNTMAAIMGWSGDDERGAINWTDDNGDTVLKIIPLEELFIGDAHDNNDFLIKHIDGENRLIRGTLQIAENINSTGGVSLNTLVSNVQTLADMSDSAAKFSFSVTTANENDECFVFTDGIPTPEINSINLYYTPTTTQDVYIAGNNVGGIKILKSGLYKVSLNVLSYIIQTNNINVLTFILSKIPENAGLTDIAYTKIPVIACDYNTFGFYGTCQAHLDVFVELNENDILTFYGSMPDPNNNTNISTIGDDPRLSIQKIR